MAANMKCPECAVALYQSFDQQEHVIKSKTSLLSFKAYGNLFVPSSSLFRIVQTTDKLVREMLVNWQDTSKQSKERVVLGVVEDLKNRVFLVLQEHSMQSHVLNNMEDDHITILIKYIAHYYIKIFVNQFGKALADSGYCERCLSISQISQRLVSSHSHPHPAFNVKFN